MICKKCSFWQQRYLYGGIVTSLADIVIDLQKQTNNPACVSAYLKGLLTTQKPIKERR